MIDTSVCGLVQTFGGVSARVGTPVPTRAMGWTRRGTLVSLKRGDTTQWFAAV